MSAAAQGLALLEMALGTNQFAGQMKAALDSKVVDVNKRCAARTVPVLPAACLLPACCLACLPGLPACLPAWPACCLLPGLPAACLLPACCLPASVWPRPRLALHLPILLPVLRCAPCNELGASRCRAAHCCPVAAVLRLCVRTG